jgi:plastocyanin
MRGFPRFYLALLALGWLPVSAWVQAELVLTVVDVAGRPAPHTVVVAPEYKSPRADIPVLIDQRNLEFKPHVVVAPLGQPVFFPNSDKTRHQVYSFSVPNDFEIKLYRQQDAPPVTFTHEGVVELGCNIHDNMKGYLFVTAYSTYAVADEQGLISLPITPRWPLRLQVWHPQLAAVAPLSITLPAVGPVSLPFALEVPAESPSQSSSLRERLQRFKKTHD